ncbi:hypothetical protein WDW89_26420 [Deltaproteobacteria bacterium TL4]
MLIQRFCLIPFWLAFLTWTFLISGCDDETTTTPNTLQINLWDLQRQMGIDPTQSRLKSYEESPATEVIKTLILGPLTFKNHGSPYDPEAPVDPKIEDALKKDIPNSAGYLAFVNLPTQAEYVEFKVPEISDGWQIIAIGSKNVLLGEGDLSDESNKDSIVYYGFSKETFKESKDIKDFTLLIKRACTGKPTPKGCATYDGKKKAIVTSAIEILGVKTTKEGSDVVTSLIKFPIVVRSKPSEFQKTAEEAKKLLDDLAVELSQKAEIPRLTVITTHKLNPTEKPECQNLPDTATTVDEYKKNCEIQEYTWVYFKE